MRCALIGFVIFALAGISRVAAAPDDGALAHYSDGAYEAAVAAATSSADVAVATGAADDANRSDNLALAARALNASAYFATRKRARQDGKRAQKLAEAALAENPEHLEAHLQAAIAMSVRGANMSIVKAFFLNLPERAREHIDHALALNPDNAWALSTSAAWRLEVARRGGGKVYGADPELGFEEFKKARALAPDNIAIAYECALRLLASGKAGWRVIALTALDDAIAGIPQTAFEKEIQKSAHGLAAALGAGPGALGAFIDAQP